MLIFKYFDGDCWNWVPGVVRVSSTMVAKRADYQGILDCIPTGAAIYPAFVDKDKPPEEIKLIRLNFKNGSQSTYLIEREFEDSLFILNERGETIDRP